VFATGPPIFDDLLISFLIYRRGIAPSLGSRAARFGFLWATAELSVLAGSFRFQN